MRILFVLVLLSGAAHVQAAIVTQTIAFEAGNFICSTYPNPCPATPAAAAPQDPVVGRFTVTYDNDDFGVWSGALDAFDMTIAGHVYELNDVRFEFRGSCSDMYAGMCNPFGPSFSVYGLAGGTSNSSSFLSGTNDFSVAFSGLPSQWSAGGNMAYSVEDALYSWSINSVGQSNPAGYFSATLVPIPAAVWLFGSALVGLGWLRRAA